MYDIIGDIHGYAKTLGAMLRKLGYFQIDGIYKHPQRKAVFVGDYIDRGPAIRECLQIIKLMVDNGFALAVMGNHEYNAICYHTPSGNSQGWLRERSPKNVKLHSATMASFKDYPKEWRSYLEWFMTLPVFLEMGTFRIVHACWDNKIVENIHNQLKGNRLNLDFIHQSSKKGTEAYNWIENLLKGFELPLPGHIKYTDKDGYIRNEIRVKWWKQLNSETYRSIAVNGDLSMPEILISPNQLADIPVYPVDAPPAFIGHYWNTGKPEPLAHNVCCVDYSVAKGGKLVAYRWNGESVLKVENLVSQENID